MAAVEPEVLSGLSGILRRIFVDYLNIPFWFRARLRYRPRRPLKEYDLTDILWRDLLGTAYRAHLPSLQTPVVTIGDSVTLREVALTNFVPRAPGKFFTSGYSLWKAEYTGGYPTVKPTAPDFAVDSERAFDLGASAAGIRPRSRPGHPVPIRVGREPTWMILFKTERRLVTVYVNARTGSVRIGYDSSKLDERFLRALTKANAACRSGWAGVVRFDGHANRQILTAYSTSTPNVERGIPIILTSGAYKKIQDIIENYGSVSLESVTGIIEEIPSEYMKGGMGKPTREWAPDVPRIGLRVDSRLLMKHPGTPSSARACAWTAIKWRGAPYYLFDRFRIGTRDYESAIEESVSNIRLSLDTLGSSPLFDFDERTPRFYEAKYGPNYFLKRVGVL